MDTLGGILVVFVIVIGGLYLMYKIAVKTFLFVIQPMVEWFEGREIKDLDKKP